MEPVAGWLARLGLGLYTAAFAEADIDCEVLRDLSDADLEKLGVTLGHRKKLLRAIASCPNGRAPNRDAHHPLQQRGSLRKPSGAS